MTTIRRQIPRGPAVLLRESHAAEVVTFQIWAGVGAADEKSAESGLAHVLEHMLFKGTARRKVGEIARDVERAGGYINAWTSHDETVFHVTLASEFAEQGLDVLFDAVSNAALDADELERELAVILEEIRMGRDNPERMNMEQLFSSMYRLHPYGRPVIGTEATVRGFTRRNVVDFYRRWYTPANLLLVAVGDFDAEHIFGRMEKLWSRIAPQVDPSAGGRRKPLPQRTPEPTQRSPRLLHCRMPVAEAHLSLGFPVVGLNHPDVPALDMLAAILGQGVSSRLETRIRRARSLATDIRAICYTPKDVGLFGVFASAPPRRLDPLVTAVAKELQRLRSEPFPEMEIEKARTLLLSEEIYAEETVDGMARKIGYYGLHADDPDYDARYAAAIASLDGRALSRVAEQYLNPERVSFALVLPNSTTQTRDKLKKSLLPAFQKGMQSPKRAARSKPPGQPDVRTLKNGDTLIVRWDPDARLVAARAVFIGGLRMESDGQQGLTSLLASSLTRGTTERSAEEIATQMDGLACSVSGFAGRNTLGLAGEFLTRNFLRGFPLFADCLRNSVFPADEIVREKELLIEEILAGAENPEYQVFQRFQQSLFGAHPYGRPMMGTAKTIDRLVPSDLTKFLRAATAPSRMVLAVDGGIHPDEIAALVEDIMGFRGSAPRPLKAPRVWKPSGKPVQVTLDMPREQSHLVVGFPGPTLRDPDRFALDILVEILGGHGGRLFSTIREKRGLAYSVSALSFEGLEPGYVALYGGTSPGREHAVFDAMRVELDRIRRVAVSRTELNRVVRHITGGRAIGRQRAATRTAGMALGYLYGLGVDADLRYAEAIRQVTSDDLARVARRFFCESNEVVSCVGPGVDRLRFI